MMSRNDGASRNTIGGSEDAVSPVFRKAHAVGGRASLLIGPHGGGVVDDVKTVSWFLSLESEMKGPSTITAYAFFTLVWCRRSPPVRVVVVHPSHSSKLTVTID